MRFLEKIRPFCSLSPALFGEFISWSTERTAEHFSFYLTFVCRRGLHRRLYTRGVSGFSFIPSKAPIGVVKLRKTPVDGVEGQCHFISCGLRLNVAKHGIVMSIRESSWSAFNHSPEVPAESSINLTYTFTRRFPVRIPRIF